MIPKIQALLTKKKYLFLLILITIGLNINTLNHKYALDDNIVIMQNLNTQSGINGIKKIFSSDAFDGYMEYKQAINPIPGGRYRPLSIATFALEQEFFGECYGEEYRKEQQNLNMLQQSGAEIPELRKQTTKLSDLSLKIVKNNEEIASYRHLFQLVFYVLLIVVIFRFLSAFIFKESLTLAFLCTLVFVVHPIHCEVLANIKSRDEIFSLLFIVLCLHESLLYFNSKSNKNLVKMALFFVLALFSKEYALILPIIIAIAWISISKAEFKSLFNKGFIILTLISFVFLLIRFKLFGNSENNLEIKEVLNDPYLYATPIETFASKIGLFFEYLKLLFFPIKLSSDYSYAHFNYLTLSSGKFIVSLLLYLLVSFVFIKLYLKRSNLLFPLAIFLGFFFLVNNILFPIGATMGERLIFHSSLGFFILLFLMYDKYLKNKVKLMYLSLFVIGISSLLSFKTITRNKDWKSNHTLFIADVKTVPNSALANSNAGFEIYNTAYLKYDVYSKNEKKDKPKFIVEIKKAIPYYKKAIRIHKNYFQAYQNLGLCYYYLGQLDLAAENWINAAKNYNGQNPALQDYANYFLNEGFKCNENRNYELAKKYLSYAANINPYDFKLWEHFGGVQFKIGEFTNAIKAFQKALAINPSSSFSYNGLQTAQRIDSVEQVFIKDPKNQKTIDELHLAYKSCQVVVNEKRLLKSPDVKK